MKNKKTYLTIIIFVLFVISVFFGVRGVLTQRQLRQTQAVLETQQINEKVLEFTKLFIGKVLKTKTEVDFETRLVLETAVRDLKDEEVLAQWNKFVNSKNETEAQDEVKNLLEMLVGKIKAQ